MDVINPARFGTDGGTIRYRDLMRYIYRVVYRTCCCFSPRSLSLSPLSLVCYFFSSHPHSTSPFGLPPRLWYNFYLQQCPYLSLPSSPGCPSFRSTCLLGIPPPLLRYFPAPILSTVKDATFFASSASIILLPTTNGSLDHRVFFSDLVILHIRQDE